MIRNIVFDMGQVLIRFDRDLFIRRLGISGEDAKILTKEVFLSLEWIRMDWGSMTDEEAVESICRRLPARLHEAARQLVTGWDKPLLPIEGMAELLKELKARGYGLYLLSNASFRQHEYWPGVPGHELFDGALISCDVGHIKPEPEIYRAFFEKFDLKPEECFFVDDAPVNVEGAIRCGMPGAVFRGDAEELRSVLRRMGFLK